MNVSALNFVRGLLKVWTALRAASCDLFSSSLRTDGPRVLVIDNALSPPASTPSAARQRQMLSTIVTHPAPPRPRSMASLMLSRRVPQGQPFDASPLLQDKDICARVASTSGPAAHTFVEQGGRELQGIGHREGGKADGQAVAWRPTPCMTQDPGYATTMSRLRPGYGTPRFGGRLESGQRRRGPCRRRGNCDARVCRISYAAGAAPSLAVTPLRTNGTSAAAGRITGPAGVAVPAPVLGGGVEGGSPRE